MTALWQWSATGIADAVRSGSVPASAFLEASRRRIEEINPVLHAFCTLALDEAAERARDIDRRVRGGGPVGPLAGVPVAVKDLIPTRGIRTTGGSWAYHDHVPDTDDVAVERLRAAGALIVGTTTASEFGYGPTGENPVFPGVGNPWDPVLTPGGSSAGSAAAVAAGMVPVALGSDGGGSIRIPAALCGVYGIKPSMGRVPLHPGCRDERFPGFSSWESLEHIGPLTRTVADSALVLSVITGPDPRDRYSVPCCDVDWVAAAAVSAAGLTFGYSPDLGHARVDPDVRVVVDAAVEALDRVVSGGVRRLDLPWPDLGPTFSALVALDTDLVGLRDLVSRSTHDVSPAVRSVVTHPWTADELTNAVRERKAACNRMWKVMADVDILLTPTLSVTAFDRSLPGPAVIDGRPVGPDAWTPFSAVANLTGQPAASVPVGFTPTGLPVGLQLIGRHLGDAAVLAASTLVHSACGPNLRWPECAAIK